MHFEKGFGSPGALKSSEYLLLTGPMGKYLLEGCLHSTQEAAVFAYLDLLGVFWQKTISEEHLQHLEKQMPKALAELELVLPAWELDMNRHMVTHLAEAVRRHGPCWDWSMFGFERLWGRLTKWMTQTSHPEATMVNAWKAFITCCIARHKSATELQDNSGEEPHAGSEAIPFHYMPTTFSRHTYKLQLPAFMLNTASTPITLFDFYGVERFGRGQHKDRFNRRAEFHLLYCKFPGLCKACDCSGTTLCTCLNYVSCGTSSCKTQAAMYPTKLRCQLLLMLGESGDSMPVSVCNSRSCAWVLNALCVCLSAMLHWLVPGLRSPSLLVIV